MPRPSPRPRVILTALAAALLASVALYFASQHFVAGERIRMHRVLVDVPPRTVAIVLGAHVDELGRPGLNLEDRLYAALTLYQAGKVKKIIVSGDHHGGQYDEVNAMQRWMLAHEVPVADVFLDHAGLRTNDTMQRAARVFGVRDSVVCTQAFHLPRALYLARAAGIDAVGYVADRHVYPKAAWDARREALATMMAVVDVAIGRGPKFLGPRIPISGDARASHDAKSLDL